MKCMLFFAKPCSWSALSSICIKQCIFYWQHNAWMFFLLFFCDYFYNSCVCKHESYYKLWNWVYFWKPLPKCVNPTTTAEFYFYLLLSRPRWMMGNAVRSRRCEMLAWTDHSGELAAKRQLQTPLLQRFPTNATARPQGQLRFRVSMGNKITKTQRSTPLTLSSHSHTSSGDLSI